MIVLLIHLISQTLSNYFNGGFAPGKLLDPNLSFMQQSSLEDRENDIKVTARLHTRHIFQLSSISPNNTIHFVSNQVLLLLLLLKKVPQCHRESMFFKY